MRHIALRLILIELALSVPSFIWAHGTPIVVGAAEGALTATAALADGEGFAPQLAFEDDEEGDPQGNFTLPNVGPVVLWQIPGFNIAGLDNSASLSIEVLSRPVKDSSPLEHRVVWYWNPTLQEVAVTDTDIHLLGTGMRHATLDASSDVPPTPFLLASSLTGQQNFHNHGLLSYGLDNDSTPAEGAYGFFARLTSSHYEPSNPFLVLFNFGIDYELVPTAALAINAAAVESLLGDYNFDGIVDAADFVVWRKSNGPEPEYDAWRENFGMTAPGGASSHAAAPEPTSLLSTLAAFTCLIRWGTLRNRNHDRLSVIRI